MLMVDRNLSHESSISCICRNRVRTDLAGARHVVRYRNFTVPAEAAELVGVVFCFCKSVVIEYSCSSPPKMQSTYDLRGDPYPVHTSGFENRLVRVRI